MQQSPRVTTAPTVGSRVYTILGATPFVASHLAAAIGIAHYGVSAASLGLAFVLLVVRLFGITGGYHRYFAHRAYKTSRVFQFLLAVVAESSSQKGVLWWAGHHRVHHKLSDAPGDVHSPIQRGFFYSHVGWLFDPASSDTRFDKMRDFERFPEIRFIDRNWLLPPVALAVACFLALGWQGLYVGFFLSTVVLWHTTFMINSVAHVVGRRRFATTDDSRNNWFLAILTLGEGWHNNHHHYQSSARNGFYWWEIDVTYYVLVALSKVGIVWDLRPVPAHVLEEGRTIDAARARGVEPPKFVPSLAIDPAE